MLAGAIGAGSFVGIWTLLPGGKAELADFVADVRAAVRRKVAVATPVEPLAVPG